MQRDQRANGSTKYDPSEHEPAIYERWEASGVFRASTEGEREPFVVMLPPPNVTGALHMGHALNGTIQDIVVRYRRMCGDEVLWMPGTDHAGIATQAIVERTLLHDEGVTRKALGREAFLDRVRDWKELYGDKILLQFRRLGCSCDWSRARFTLDEQMSRAVRESFVRMWEKGLIYRGPRIVNWDCKLGTAVSDDEVNMTPSKGKLYYLQYPVEGEESRWVTVATTRPETIPGDTGVAVHPSDSRYANLIGKRLIVPVFNNAIPVVADESVDPSYGTGAVKVTPAHDSADYERARRHGLAIVTVFEPDGRLNSVCGPFKGLSREAGRKAVVEAFQEQGHLERIETIEHGVPVSDRSGTIIEPLISEQWFLRMEELAEPAIAAVRTGRLRFKPERWTKVYLDWLENVQDWCISRQLWWGHRLPVWYDEDAVPVASREDLQIGDTHPLTRKPIVRRDDDVLDTWASSWLWPFATLGWPESTADFKRFYPTHFLSTASEIIYLWVARMVMAGYELLPELPESERCPFSTCYIHATVLDAQGRRMSKSAGNGIDPLAMIEQYGADAVRFSLILLTREGQDVKLDESRFKMGERFVTKLWNVAGFCLSHLEGEVQPEAENLELEDRWIVSRLAALTENVENALLDYRFNDAASAVYRFIWNDFCDWYVEIIKPRLYDTSKRDITAAYTLGTVLDTTLRLLHPFMPFVTEVLWHRLHETLGKTEKVMLINAAWPYEAREHDPAVEKQFALVMSVVGAVRQLRRYLGCGPRERLDVVIGISDSERRLTAQQFLSSLVSAANARSVEIRDCTDHQPGTLLQTQDAVQVRVAIPERLDAAAVVKRLERELEQARRSSGAQQVGSARQFDTSLGIISAIEANIASIVKPEQGECQNVNKKD